MRPTLSLRRNWRWMLGGVALAAGLVLAVFARKRDLESRDEGMWERAMISSAEARQQYLEHWLAERQSDVRVLALQSADVAESFGNGRAVGDAKEDRLQNLLRATAGRQDVVAVMALDTVGRVVAASGDPPSVPPSESTAVRAAARAPAMTRVEHIRQGSLSISFLAPVRRGGTSGAHVGWILGRWRVTAGTMPRQVSAATRTDRLWLAARRADTVYMVHDSSGPGAALSASGITRERSPVLYAAVRGARDTSGVFPLATPPVIAAVRAVSGSTWSVVSQINRAEALGAARQQVRFETAIAGVLLSLSGLGLVTLHRSRRAADLRRIADSEARLSTIVASATDAIVTLDGKWCITLANAAAGRLLDQSPDELQDRDLFDLIPESDAPVWREQLAALANGSAERLMMGEEKPIHMRAAFGSLVPVEATAARAQANGSAMYVLVLRDVRERTRLQEQIRQAQKMDAVGRLAGGIAHDFNNLLTAITVHTELLLDEMSREDPRRTDLREIRKAARRASELTAQLLAFGRRQVLVRKPVDVDATVADLATMLRRVVGEHISLDLVLAGSLPAVWADRGQLEQVVMNLVLNARDAMPSGGFIRIVTSHVRLQESYRHVHGSVPPGDYVTVLLRDSGTGIDPEAQPHIFEPFFTTKPAGKGTGLGLATVHGIIEQSGGFISLASSPSGTAFTLWLPAVEAKAEEESEHTSGEFPVAHTAETVMVVEDEDMVRSLVVRILRRAGYEVISAANGEEALSLSASHGDPISLVLTDVVMPKMGGQKLIEQLRKIRPETRVLMMSGHAADVEDRERIVNDGTPFLQKPFRPEQLVNKVREVLDGGG